MRRVCSVVRTGCLAVFVLGCGSASGGSVDGGGTDTRPDTGSQGMADVVSSNDGSPDLPPGAKVGTVGSGVPPSCTGEVYVPVSAANCPFIDCSGTAYALCYKGTFGACDCDLPAGYTELTPKG
jgi:hypothetical protein